MNITTILQNMKAHSGETFTTSNSKEFKMEYAGGALFDVTPEEGERTHQCTISNLERVVDAVNNGNIPNLRSATIAETQDASGVTASTSYIKALLTDPRIV